jgi:23S rRNA (uracil1939-C5)-methyltransferase
MGWAMNRKHRGRPARPPAEEILDLGVMELGAQGDGVAAHDGGELFVPYTLPGDRVRARRIGPHHAVPLSWDVRAPAHQDPPCRHFTACGGCALQHLDDPAYAAWKIRQLETALARRALTNVEIMPLARTAPGERRRAAFAAARRGSAAAIGFHGYKSSRIVDLLACPVLDPQIVAVVPALRALATVLIRDGHDADFLVTRTDSGLDLLVSRIAPPDRAQREAVAAFATAHDLARIAWRRSNETPETLVMTRVPRVWLGGVLVDIPPGAFLQASQSGEAAIASAVLAGIGPAKRVADLYAGCGTLTFPMARQARVHAVEGAKDLADALGAAVRQSGLAGRIALEIRDLARRPLLQEELADFDAVVFDPPRDGAAAQAGQIAQSRVPLVVGVSCNPATFARDARTLVDGGYRLRRITPVDQFLWSPHLELVGVFTR